MMYFMILLYETIKYTFSNFPFPFASWRYSIKGAPDSIAGNVVVVVDVVVVVVVVVDVVVVVALVVALVVVVEVKVVSSFSSWASSWSSSGLPWLDTVAFVDAIVLATAVVVVLGLS